MKKKWIIGLGIVLVIILIAGATIYRNYQPNVQTLKGVAVSKGTIGQEVFASGQLELKDQTEVPAPFSGKVKTVEVKLGEQVQAGQVLFAMDTVELNKQIQTAKLTLSDAKAALNQAKVNNAFNIDDAKKAMDQANATLTQVKNGAQIAGAIPGTFLSLSDAQANYDKAKEAYDRLVSTFSTSTLENNVKRAQSAVDDLQSQLAAAVVKAPVAGTVVELNASEGASSSGLGLSTGGAAGLASPNNGTGNSMVTIANLGTLRARVKVNEIDSTQVKVGQQVKVSCDAVGKDFSGKVDSVAPTAVTTGGTRGEETTVEVVVSLDNSSGLKPGYNVNAAIKVSENTNALLVPVEAVTDKNSKKVVFVAQNGEAKMQEVTEGITDETNVEITSGVKEGDEVILNPAANLKEGDKVKVNE